MPLLGPLWLLQLGNVDMVIDRAITGLSESLKYRSEPHAEHTNA